MYTCNLVSLKATKETGSVDSSVYVSIGLRGKIVWTDKVIFDKEITFTNLIPTKFSRKIAVDFFDYKYVVGSGLDRSADPHCGTDFAYASHVGASEIEFESRQGHTIKIKIRVTKV